MSVVCVQVEFSVSDWSLVQRSPTKYSVWVWSWSLDNEKALAQYGAVAPVKKNVHLTLIKLQNKVRRDGHDKKHALWDKECTQSFTRENVRYNFET